MAPLTPPTPITPQPQQTQQQRPPWYQVGGATVATKYLVQQRARQILESDDYAASLSRRIKSDTLPPGVETMLWAYAFGKPMEQIEVTVKQDLTNLSIEELLLRARQCADKLEEAKALEDALPVEYKVA